MAPGTHGQSQLHLFAPDLALVQDRGQSGRPATGLNQRDRLLVQARLLPELRLRQPAGLQNVANPVNVQYRNQHITSNSPRP